MAERHLVDNIIVSFPGTDEQEFHTDDNSIQEYTAYEDKSLTIIIPLMWTSDDPKNSVGVDFTDKTHEYKVGEGLTFFADITHRGSRHEGKGALLRIFIGCGTKKNPNDGTYVCLVGQESAAATEEKDGN
jgi:hypothetical protein